MSKNVQELAEELGIDKNELAAMINGMSLGLMGVTGSTILTPMDVERIKKKHAADKQAPKEVEPQPETKASHVVRRRSKTSEVAAVAPVRRRRRKVNGEDEEETVVAPVRRRAKTVKETEVVEPKPRRKIVSVEPKKIVEKEVVAAVEEAKPAPEVEEKVVLVEPTAEPVESKVEVASVEPAVDVVKEETMSQESAPAEAAVEPAEQVAEVKPEVKAEVKEAAPPVVEKAKPAKEAAAKEKKGSTPYAAKIVHRPGNRVAPKKPVEPEPVPVQQPPRRRTSAAAKADSARQQARQAKEAELAAKAAEAAKVEPAAAPEPVAVEPSMVEVLPAAVVEAVSKKKGDVEGGKRRANRKKGGATIVKKMDKSVVLDRLNAEGKDFTPGPKRQSQRESGRGESGRSRKRVVEGTDLYSDRRKGRKSQKQKKKPQKTKITEAAEHKRVIRVEDAITIGDLAHQMGVKAAQVALKLLEAGLTTATINTTIDYETAAIIAEEFNHTVENVAFDIGEFYDTEPDPEETLKPRAPVVTVMGHVDHGKTSLLDAIRSSTVASGEAGGITQHIGAYQVKTDAGVITFLDTPGHEAFTALRARGAKATDITVLVVAADDGVMPQTMEAINHSQAAGVPILVAINKIDKPGANVDRVKQALTEYDLVAEEWGGSTLFVEVSAKERINIDELIETIMLQAELQELRANPDRDAQGLVIEAELDVGRGSVATVLVQRGTLRQGDIIVSGQFYGKVRTMNNELGQLVSEALPSQPVEITGLGGVPEAGEPFFVVQDEKDAKRICQNVIDQRRKEKLAARAKESGVSLEDLSALIKEGQLKELKVILKGDVQGSVEAIKQAFSKLGNDEVAVAVIHSGVGGITENDVNLAASSEKGAVVVGFNVRPDNRAQIMAEKYAVKILTHSIIYDAIEQIRVLLEGMLEPLIEEETIGSAEVRDIFTAPKVGTVAGCYVTSGIMKRGAKARVVRDSRVMFDSTIESLRRFKDNVTEVKTGFECGLSVENYNDIKLGDTIECYILKEVAAKLE